MKRTLAASATSAETSHPPAISMMVPAQLDTILVSSHRILENMQTFNRLWMDAVQETNSAATDLPARFAKCSNAAEGAVLCNDWVRERATRLVSYSQEVTRLWMRLYGTPLTGPNETAGSYRKNQYRTAGRARKRSSREA